MTQAPIEPRHKDEAERLLNKSYDRILTIAQTLANDEEKGKALAEIDRIAVAGQWGQNDMGSLFEVAAIAAPYRASDPVAWMRELVAEGLWHRKRKALDLPAEYLPSSRTDFMVEAAAIISNANPQPAAVDGLVELLQRAAKFANQAGGFDWNEDRCVMVAVHLAGDITQALAQIERKPEDGNG